MTSSDRPLYATHVKQHVVLRFVPQSHGKPSLDFPCNAAGHVEMDCLSVQELNDYLFARALRGRDYAFPVVERVGP
jgi:hypothetical protein